jgi:hypothetical protein
MPSRGEGRLLGWLLSLYGLGVFGYLTATLASHSSAGNAPPRKQNARATEARSGPAQPASGATSGLMDWISASAAERTSEYGASDQCPNERNPIFFTPRVYWRRRR